METDALIEVVRRTPVFAALRERPMDRRDLQEHLDVSRPTVHRLTRALDERGLVKRVDGEFTLTALGEAVATEVATFEHNVETAHEIAPLLRVAGEHDLAVDVSAFADATVTSAAPGNPYRPVNRFMSLVENTDTLRGLDPAALNPLHIEDIYRRIVDGMETDAVFPPGVVEDLLTSNPERARTALESGNLTLRTHDELPFGLTLCDERVGVGVYDAETGMLRTYIDTDAPAAREWAEATYETYRNESTVLDEHADFADLPPVAALAEED